MEEKRDVCPYCGGTELAKGIQSGHGGVLPMGRLTVFSQQRLIHLICRRCGTVVRSYIENPEDFH